MTVIQRHSDCPDIVVAREERTFVFLMVAIVCLVISFAMMVWTQRIIATGNTNLEMMRYRLNDFSAKVQEAERSCEEARAVCQMR